MSKEKETALIVSTGTAVMAAVSETDTGYLVRGTSASVDLQRDVDFGVINGTKSPSLFKAGAEKVLMAYGLMVRPVLETKIEKFDDKTTPFCAYTVRCELWKGFADGDGNYREVLYSVGYGSANTNEKRNGMNNIWNAANSTLKMAKKRAMVDAALTVSGLSSMFTQDMDDEAFKKKVEDLLEKQPTDKISKQQFDRITKLAVLNGMNKEKLIAWLTAEFGVTKASEITQEKFEPIIEKLKGMNEHGSTESN